MIFSGPTSFPRKLLKDDAVPTLFDYNKDKEPSKRKTSCARLKIVNKKKFCEEAFEHYYRWENLEMEINSKKFRLTKK